MKLYARLILASLSIGSLVACSNAPVEEVKTPEKEKVSSEPPINLNTSDIKIPEDLMPTIVRETKGKGPAVVKGDMVWISYTTKLASGKKVDTNVSATGIPLYVKVGAGRFLPGLERGLIGMQSGSKRTLKIPPALGYGAKGSGAEVPPNSDLEMDVEVLYHINPEQVNEYEMKDIVVGTGPEVKKGDNVMVNYVGKYVNGLEFDSSYSKKEPLPVTVGGQGIIQGWGDALVGMRKGGKRHIILPPNLGYGGMDYGNIPANSVLVFDLELLEIKK